MKNVKFDLDVAGLLDELKHYKPDNEIDKYVEIASVLHVLLSSNALEDIDLDSISDQAIYALIREVGEFDPDNPEFNQKDNMFEEVRAVLDMQLFLLLATPLQGGNPDDILF